MKLFNTRNYFIANFANVLVVVNVSVVAAFIFLLL